MEILETEAGAPRSIHASFVVRVWLEPAGPGDPAEEHDAAPGLRGSVQHVGHDRLRYFASLDAMQAIIARIVGTRSVRQEAAPAARMPAELTR